MPDNEDTEHEATLIVPGCRFEARLHSQLLEPPMSGMTRVEDYQLHLRVESRMMCCTVQMNGEQMTFPGREAVGSERTQITTWLRERADHIDGEHSVSQQEEAAQLRDAADAIDRGEHNSTGGLPADDVGLFNPQPEEVSEGWPLVKGAVVVLTQDVANPRVDRRHKNSFLHAETIKAGRRFRVVLNQISDTYIDELICKAEVRGEGAVLIEDLASRLDLDVIGTQFGATISATGTGAELYAALLPYLRPSAENLASVIHSMTGRRENCDVLVGELLDAGAITLADVARVVRKEVASDTPEEQQEEDWKSFQARHFR